MLYSFFTLLSRIIPAREVFAHCDIPCGIYTPQPAQTAARTVVKMVEKLQEISPTDIHGISRLTAVKEEHAQIAKEQLLILWTDYFAEEHLKAFPDLHETFWKATKLCSKVKQEVNMQAAQDLQKAVDEIAEMFQEAERAKKQ
ncbi:superoxide dismutase, Ni [Patescibacteria group bacterium]|nr:superoxide dismutase, Ni [Patescibacteria group bacterium]